MKNKISIDTVKKIESILLFIAGFIHILYLLIFVDYQTVAMESYVGPMVFGILYVVFGICIYKAIIRILPIALIINIIGLMIVLTLSDISPLRTIDPLLIIIDLISIPLLAYLFVNRNKIRN